VPCPLIHSDGPFATSRASKQRNVKLVVAFDDEHGVPLRLGRFDARLHGADVGDHVRRRTQNQRHGLVHHRIAADDGLDALKRQNGPHVLLPLCVVGAFGEQGASDFVHESEKGVVDATHPLLLDPLHHELDRPFDARPYRSVVGEDGRVVEDHPNDLRLHGREADVVEDVLLTKLVFRLFVVPDRPQRIDDVLDEPMYRIRRARPKRRQVLLECHVRSE